jgi:Zn-dependent metalloprotease
VKVFGPLRGLAVVLAAFGLVAGVGSAATKVGAAAGDPAAQLRSLEAGASGDVSITAEKSTSFAGFVRAAPGGDLLPDARSADPAGKAQEFLSRYGTLLGLGGAGSTLVRTDTAVDQQGDTHVSYEQRYKGVPVFGAILKAHVDADGRLTAVNGVAVPAIDLATTPKLSPADAGSRAIAHVLASPPRDELGQISEFLTDLRAAETTLYVYRTGLIRGVPGTNQLVYEVEVTNGRNVREMVYVHAHAGKILNRYTTMGHALFRRLFEQNTSNQVWMEGQPFPGTLNVDQQNIVNFSGQTYRFFFNAFGYDSWDGHGAEMQSVNNDPRISCPNANWNGATTNYCTGVTGDDTVGHEWGHAYTDSTHDLIYQWQSGALNESYSDIWGEVVDFLNGAGTDTPGGTRSADLCSTHSPALPGFFINSPAAIAGECAAAGAQFGAALTPAGTTGDVVLANDGVAPSTSDACEPLPAGSATGRIVLADRGTCAFTIKVKNAQNAGAIAAVIANNTAAPPNTMAGADPTITIPSVMIPQLNGNLIKQQLAGGTAVNVTMRDRGGVREDSYRWLSGEDDPAFGGAIRDMWNPRCYADPGKVTDAEYHCATSDSGGVHTNSGVPNHGFALLVDGGTYNGRTVAAIGLTKAAHLYWRAQAVYQTRTSDFDDHADALETSCTDLLGVNLQGLSTGAPVGPSGQMLTLADCAAVTQMIAAVELRTEPTQCNFQPLLKPNPPDVCTDASQRLFREDFKHGLRDWTVTNEGRFAGWPGLNWVESKTLPGGRAGSAAFAENTELGNCDGGAGDVSGVMRLESPAILINRPFSKDGILRLSFEHYVATESGFDGGNVSISVNGGAYQLIPASAFLFNPYNMTMVTAAGGNTSPLAGQPGFSGTDGGTPLGSWGQSQVDLSVLGVKSGDTIRLRFDFGMDGCTGIDGWYVDEVQITACKRKKNVSARPRG